MTVALNMRHRRFGASHHERSAVMKRISFKLAALKPRNTLALLASKRSAGKHSGNKRSQSTESKDVVQRLREAGL